MDEPRNGEMTREEVRSSDYPFDRIPFDHDHCFLCGAPVDEEGRTREHVFPKWLQNRFDLWNQQLTLLNGTYIPYRQLTVPCCIACNTGPLSELENDVRSALEGGYEGFRALPDLRVFQWAGKLMFGILFKEISLEHDRRARTGETILAPKSLDDFSMLHDLLQSIRVPTNFEGGPIFSVLVFKVHELDGAAFDFADSIGDQVVSVRLGEVGVIVSLMDAGLSASFGTPIMDALGGKPLHPIQFDELLAHVVSVKQRMTRTMKFMLAGQQSGEGSLMILRMPLAGMSAKPIVRELNADELRPILRHYLSRWGPVTKSVWNREHGVGTTVFERPGHIALCDADFTIVDIVPYEHPNGRDD